jgi:hypothetical protein
MLPKDGSSTLTLTSARRCGGNELADLQIVPVNRFGKADIITFEEGVCVAAENIAVTLVAPILGKTPATLGGGPPTPRI